MTAGDITAVILTLDEERNLPRALTSLPKGVRIFVLDAGSTDHTVQFARGAGAEVVQREWTDYVDARTFAVQRVRTPWVLMLDADEALDDVLREAILRADRSVDAYAVARTTYFCGKPMRLWRNERLVRFFRAGSARLVARPAAGGDALLHERWVGDAAAGELPGTLLHYSYPDVATYRAKYARYTALEAAGMQPSLGRLLAALVKAPLSLGWMLFVKGAILDGPRGIYVAYRSALYPAAVAWKALTP
ncbi:MAG: glycosyltransferase family 2 protein [Candidatus Eremiobacteraeota bacterium]|nr:glycosyltransferase family 2 protein [Candidatus Eremiobacteraeota bacterium]